MAEETKTVETVEEAPKAKKTVRKTTAKKAVKKETEVVEEKAPAKKAPAKKAAAKKTTAKKTTAKKAEAVEEVKTEEVTPEVVKAPKAKKTTKKAEAKKEITFKTRPAVIKDYEALLGPVVTEKTQNLQLNQNTMVFKVNPNATADEVKAAVQAVFGVKVDRVNIVNVLPRAKRSTRYAGKVPGFKKAYVKVNKDFNLGEIAKTANAENA